MLTLDTTVPRNRDEPPGLSLMRKDAKKKTNIKYRTKKLMKLRAWDVERKKNQWNGKTEAEKNTHREKAARARRLYRAQQNPKKKGERVANK